MLSALERAGELWKCPRWNWQREWRAQSESQLPDGYQLGTYRVEALLGVGDGGGHRAVDMRLTARSPLKLLPRKWPAIRSGCDAFTPRPRPHQS